MKIAVDARWMVGNYRGMGRYAHSILKPVGHNVVAFLPKKFPSSIYKNEKYGMSFFPVWEQYILPYLCKKNQITHLVCPYNTAPLFNMGSTKSILVVHDLIFLESWKDLPPSSSVYQNIGRIYRRIIVPALIKKSKKIISVSEYTKKQIVDVFDFPPENVVVIPNILDEGWFESNHISCVEKKPYLLAVSGEAPSKNLNNLIKAFSLFFAKNPRDDCKLLIIGVKQKFQREYIDLAIKLNVANNVEFKNFVKDDELKVIYKQAKLFVMPSLYEGFGIPLIEAMASGTAVACSNTTSMPEVMEDLAWYFNPRDPEDMANKIFEAWNSGEELEIRAKKGFVRARNFRERTQEQLIIKFWKEIYE